jgi:hypothetical protein
MDNPQILLSAGATWDPVPGVLYGDPMERFLTLVFGLGGAFGLIVLTSRAWQACQVDIGGVGNGATLLFAGVPVAVVVNVVLFNLVYRFSRMRKSYTAMLAACVAIAIADLALFSWAGTPTFVPAPVCPANVPPWWPSSIPT